MQSASLACNHALHADGGQLLVEDQHFDNSPVDLPLEVLLGKPPKMTRDFIRESARLPALALAGVGLEEAITRVLHFPAVASKQFLITIPHLPRSEIIIQSSFVTAMIDQKQN